MRRHFRNLATVFVSLYFCLISTAFAAETIKIATFNCEFLVREQVHVKFDFPFRLSGGDKTQWEKAGYRDAKFKEAAKAVAQVIKAIDADVISLVEVGNERDVEELRAEVANVGLSYPHWAVCDSQDYTTGQHVAVLSKRSIEVRARVISGRESYDTELDDPESEEETGISKGLHVSFDAAGQPVHLFVVHLASERGGHEQDAQRIAQASIVRRTYLEYLNRGEHVIVAGDLNDHRGQPALRRIRGKDDIYEDLLQTGFAEFFAAAEIDTRWTYQFQGERQQIDHILISRSLKDASKKGGIKTKVVPVDNPLASDHRALVVTLELK